MAESGEPGRCATPEPSGIEFNEAPNALNAPSNARKIGSADNLKTLGKTTVVEAPGIEPGSRAASRATSTSVVPVLISPKPRPGTRLGSGQPRCMSRPAPRRHRAARLLALTSGPPPAAERAVDVRPKPELFSSLLLTQRGRGVRYSHVYFSRFYEPGARLAFAQPTTPSKPIRPRGNAVIRDQRAPQF